MSHCLKNLHASPAKCLDINTEQDKIYIGTQDEEDKMANFDRINFSGNLLRGDAEECRGFCLTAGTKYFSYDISHLQCYCINQNIESRDRGNSVSGNTSLATCNGERKELSSL